MIKTLSERINNQVLRLSSWPSLARFSQESVPHVTRICALLARRPSVGMFIPMVLNMSPPIAYSLLETLYVSGHIYTDSVLVSASAEAGLLEAELVSHQESAGISFITRLWKRLTTDQMLSLNSK